MIGESGALLRDAGIWRDMINEHATDPENARRLWGRSLMCRLAILEIRGRVIVPCVDGLIDLDLRDLWIPSSIFVSVL